MELDCKIVKYIGQWRLNSKYIPAKANFPAYREIANIRFSGSNLKFIYYRNCSPSIFGVGPSQNMGVLINENSNNSHKNFFAILFNFRKYIFSKLIPGEYPFVKYIHYLVQYHN